MKKRLTLCLYEEIELSPKSSWTKSPNFAFLQWLKTDLYAQFEYRSTLSRDRWNGDWYIDENSSQYTGVRYPRPIKLNSKTLKNKVRCYGGSGNKFIICFIDSTWKKHYKKLDYTWGENKNLEETLHFSRLYEYDKIGVNEDFLMELEDVPADRMRVFKRNEISQQEQTVEKDAVAEGEDSDGNHKKPSKLLLSMLSTYHLNQWIFYALASKLWLHKWSFKRWKNFAMSSAIDLLKSEKLSEEFDQFLDVIIDSYNEDSIAYHEWYLYVMHGNEEIKVSKSDLEYLRKILYGMMLTMRENIKSMNHKDDKSAVADEKQQLGLTHKDLDIINNIIKMITPKKTKDKELIPLEI